MKASLALLHWLASPDFENCILHSYRDQGGILTIGVGHTGPDVREDQVCTYDQAMEWLAKDIENAENVVNKYAPSGLAQWEFDALVSLAFNIGWGNFQHSTVLAKLNAGDKQGAADSFKMWNKAGGQISNGLVKRRAVERSMFLHLNDKLLEAYK